MVRFVSARTATSRAVVSGIAVALVASLTACGGADGTTEKGDTENSATEDATTGEDSTPVADGEPESATSSPAGQAPDDEVCAALEGIEDDLAILQSDLSTDDPQAFVAQVSVAAERFAATEPPAPVAPSWEALADFFTMTDEALQGVEITTEDDLTEALRFDDEQAFAMVIQFPGHAEAVGAYLQETCDIDLGIVPPAIADVCDALDPAHLGSVFDAVPAGENRRWGHGVVECFWADDSGNEVGVVVGPTEALRRDLLDDQEPVDYVETGGSTVEVYDGALGPLRSAAGRTAATDVKESTVMASVRTGDATAEQLKAIALADLVSLEVE